MTAIVGIRYESGIVVAADSRVSGGYMDNETPRKLYELRTANGVAVLGCAGTLAHIEGAILIIKQGMKEADSPYSAMTICEEGINAMRDRYKEAAVHFVLAARCGRSMGLYEVMFDGDSRCGTGRKCERYAVAGLGGPVAEYIIKRTWPAKRYGALRREEAEALAMYTIDEVSWAKVAGCGGATRLRTLTDEVGSPVFRMGRRRKQLLRRRMREFLPDARMSLSIALSPGSFSRLE